MVIIRTNNKLNHLSISSLIQET